MDIISQNFILNKYNIQVRLVEEADADFILKLRTDPQLIQFLHATDNNIEKQREWIREYKKRELQGLEYYFIYYHNDVPIGVNRIYDIKDERATSGSWICQKGLSLELPILTLIIVKEILFDMLNLKYDFFDVRKQNKKIIRTHLLFEAEQVNEDELSYYFVLSKENFYKNRDIILNLLF